MNDVISWCNVNQGFLMFSLTLVYVVATIAICIFNAKAANAAKKQTEEMMKQDRDANRPKIDIRFDIIRSGLLCFIVENIGNKPAYNVCLNLCQEFIDNVDAENDRNRIQASSNAKMNISPEQKITILIDSHLQFGKIATIPAVFKIQYNDEYVEEITIDLMQYAFMIIYHSPLEDLSQHIKELKEKQIKFQDKLLKQNESLFKAPIRVLSVDNEHDGLKFKVYRVVCILKDGSLKEISEKSGVEITKAHEILCDLYLLDKLVTTYPMADFLTLDENNKWYKS